MEQILCASVRIASSLARYRLLSSRIAVPLMYRVCILPFLLDHFPYTPSRELFVFERQFTKETTVIGILSSARQLCISAVPSLMDSRQHQVVAIIAIFLTLAIISVFLRLISRKISKAKFWWDDYLIVLGLVMSFFAAPVIMAGSLMTLNG